VGQSLKQLRFYCDGGFLQRVVVARAAVNSVKADLCSPGFGGAGLQVWRE
jgi:hypothetical protein